ncbi:nuclear transport factor 2 family protein [Tenacibaculum amylolyticum]|uniref:nuclear transport factor 2 family protein n=1 Tax=Tenacibaculum amylolyticum TaxID=104269 RepID=UPI00389577FC
MNTELQTNTKTVIQTIENLIAAGTQFDIDTLESLYHGKLQVIFINTKNEKVISNKQQFIALFQQKKENNEAPLNTWSQFHHTEIKETTAHIILSRKVNLTGKEEHLVLSIDLVYEENRWQIIREIIVTQ